MITVGILLEVLAAGLGTTSKQLIAYSEHVQKRWIFHLGACINVFLGPVVDASAYAFAPQVVVAPFACLDVIFNALTAPYTLAFQEEKLTSVHVAGTLLVSLGAVCTSLFGSVEDRTLNVLELEAQLLSPRSICYITLELIAIIVINMCLRTKLLSPRVRGMSLGVVAGVLMGNVFCVKGVIGLVRVSVETRSADAWLRPTPYILIAGAACGAVFGHIFMRKGLGEYKGVFMVTMFEGAHITAACLSGCVVMSELASAPWRQCVCYWLSVGLLVLGMAIMNTGAENAKLLRADGAPPRKISHIAQSFVEDSGEGDPMLYAGSGASQLRARWLASCSPTQADCKATAIGRGGQLHEQAEMIALPANPQDGGMDERAPLPLMKDELV